MKVRGDTRTLDLLDWEPPDVSVGFDEDTVKGWTLSAKIARAVSLALRADLQRGIQSQIGAVGGLSPAQRAGPRNGGDHE